MKREEDSMPETVFQKEYDAMTGIVYQGDEDPDQGSHGTIKSESPGIQATVQQGMDDEEEAAIQQNKEAKTSLYRAVGGRIEGWPLTIQRPLDELWLTCEWHVHPDGAQCPAPTFALTYQGQRIIELENGKKTFASDAQDSDSE